MMEKKGRKGLHWNRRGGVGNCKSSWLSFSSSRVSKWSSPWRKDRRPAFPCFPKYPSVGNMWATQGVQLSFDYEIKNGRKEEWGTCTAGWDAHSSFPLLIPFTLQNFSRIIFETSPSLTIQYFFKWSLFFFFLLLLLLLYYLQLQIEFLKTEENIISYSL